ncbi:MAG: efflux RND transporter periplasmic adaptor subunit [Winogradskyella sp.]|nr:efflux RND transporter periplasmic adaptor subunit [Winogradskyella sp.]
MKLLRYILITFTLVVFSCGEEQKLDTSQIELENVLKSNSLDSVKAKKDELYAIQQKLSAQLKLLNDRITLLDENSEFPLVTAFAPKQEPFDHFVELQGNVTTKNLVVITSEYSGLLTHVYVKEGQNVAKGQLLAKIDDGGLQQQLAQVKIQRDLAKTTFDRQKRLWEQKIGSEIQYLQAKSNYEAQDQMVNQMNQQLAKARVTAPFSGTIDDVITDKGSIVAPGTPIMRIVNLKDMYIETEVPERYLADITENKDVVIEFPIINTSVKSKIRQTSNFINPANRTYTIEVPIPVKDNNIKPNLTAKLNINDYSNPQAILLPQSIISEDADGNQYVFVLKDVNDAVGKATQASITTGKTQGDFIEVLSGISGSDLVIQEGARSVKDGQTVKLSESI